MTEIVTGLVGSAFLGAFYFAVRTKWPQSYFSITDFVARRVSGSPVRYAAFRFVPVVAVCGFAAVTMDRLGHNANVAVALTAVLHGASTNGRGLLDALRFRSEFARETQALLNAAILVGVFAAAAVGWLLSKTESFARLIPQPSELASALWTAIVAGTAGAALLEISRGEWVEPRRALDYSRERVGRVLWERATKVALAHGTDPALVQAILLAENLARPAWVRRLERLKGIVFKRGTYGVMQVQASAPLTDAQSIDISVAEFLRRIQLRGDYFDELQDVLHRYNPNPRFVSLATDFYSELRESSAGNRRPRTRRTAGSLMALFRRILKGPDGR
jgi:hypothetical protein